MLARQRRGLLRDDGAVCADVFHPRCAPPSPLQNPSLTPFAAVFTKAHLENQTLATYSLAILNATACFGRLFVGLIADRCGVFNTIIPFSFVMATMVFGM